MHNVVREKAKLSALGWSGRLETAARKHATWMAENANLDHTGDGGSSVGDRVKKEGFIWGRVAENIAYGQATALEVMRTWLKSPGHNANIHLGDITVMGAACILSVTANSETPYWCVVFGREL